LQARILKQVFEQLRNFFRSQGPLCSSTIEVIKPTECWFSDVSRSGPEKLEIRKPLYRDLEAVPARRSASSCNVIQKYFEGVSILNAPKRVIAEVSGIFAPHAAEDFARLAPKR